MMSERKVTPVSARKPIKRKPKDKPKRPLSAYNFFFKEERQKIIRGVECEDEALQKEIDPELTPELVQKLKKENGKVSFEEMGKVIGKRWKDITANSERSEYYKTKAEGDTKRYKREMEEYNHKQEEKRKEKSRPPQVHYPMYGQGHQMPHHSMQPHPDMGGHPSAMYASRMGYMPGYHTDPNVHHGYGQIPMVGSYSPYYMHTPPPENHYSTSAPAPTPQGSGDSNHMNRSGSNTSSGPPSMSYPPPHHPSQSEYASYPHSTSRGSDQYSYGQHPPSNQGYYHSDNPDQEQQW